MHANNSYADKSDALRDHHDTSSATLSQSVDLLRPFENSAFWPRIAHNSKGVS